MSDKTENQSHSKKRKSKSKMSDKTENQSPSKKSQGSKKKNHGQSLKLAIDEAA